ncbi:hypothetical protein TI03_00295 [Achromatium sp. WMS1]|nr:hypothetical protein TI03_00295 [Achromatium sp. WMS1]
MKINNNTSNADKPLYWGLVILLIISPIPWGGNFVWVWSGMQIWVLGLSFTWLMLFAFHKVRLPPALITARPVLLLFILWLGWILLQLIPWPYTWLHFILPKVASHSIEYNPQITSWQPSTFAYIAVDRNGAFNFFLKSLHYILVFILLLLLVHTPNRVKILLSMLVMGGVWQAFYGVWTTLPHGIHAVGSFINRNHYAGYLEMSIALGMGLLLSEPSQDWGQTWRKRIIAISQLMLGKKIRIRVFLAVMVIGLVISHSRTGNAAFFISLIVSGILWTILTRKTRRSTLLLFASLLVIDLFIVGSWFGIDQVLNRLQNTVDDLYHTLPKRDLDRVVIKSPNSIGNQLAKPTSMDINILSYELREEVYADTWRLINDYPWTGTGAGSFYIAFNAYKQADIHLYYKHTHNDYLEITADLGIFGLILAGLIIILSLSIAIMAQAKRRSRTMQGTGFAATMGIISILIHSLTDFNLQIPANAQLFSVLLALAWLANAMPLLSTKTSTSYKH